MNTKRYLHRICLGILCVGVLGLLGTYAAINVWPSLGAQAADGLRGVFGNETVAQLETMAFEAKDTVVVCDSNQTHYESTPDESEADSSGVTFICSPLRSRYPGYGVI